MEVIDKKRKEWELDVSDWEYKMSGCTGILIYEFMWLQRNTMLLPSTEQMKQDLLATRANIVEFIIEKILS